MSAGRITLLDSPAMSADIHIREADKPADFATCLALERAVWGLADSDVTAEAHVIASVHAGGLVQLAETPGGEPIAFCYAFPGFRDGRPHLHSHMLAVLPDHQGRGVGARLKWAQREAALARGIDLILWTFDPLQARNANLNLRRLGALAWEFVPNMYGTTSSALEHGLPTDRLVARWELKATGVVERSTQGEPPRIVSPPDLPLVNAVEWSAGWPVSSDPGLELDAPRLLLEIPPDWDTLCGAAPRLAQDWQSKIRSALQHYLGRGYQAAGFAPAQAEGRRRPFYVLEKRT